MSDTRTTKLPPEVDAALYWLEFPGDDETKLMEQLVRSHITAQAERYSALVEAAEEVCWFDWSTENGDYAVAAVERLRAALKEVSR